MGHWNILNNINNENTIRVFGLLSSSLFPERFGRYVLRPFSGVCRTREPSRNFELRPLLKPRGSPVLIPLVITGKYSSIVTRLKWGLNLQPPDDCLLRETMPITVMLDNSERIFGTYKLNVLIWLELLLLCMIFYLCIFTFFFFLCVNGYG